MNTVNRSKNGTNRPKKPYKIVLENVTQEKKKLQSIASYNDRAPPGYTFVPVGTPDLTEKCKELCRNKGLTVHIVSATPKNKAASNENKISHHLHRIGYHFPNDVVDTACDWLGYDIRGGHYTKNANLMGTQRLATRLGIDSRGEHSQDTSKQIRVAIKELFPLIPDADIESIIDHAFREGTSRVGNASELPLSRRVQLAVVAHIRHEYTDYDKLLKTGSYIQARTKVEPVCLEQLMKWRGEGEKSDVELEDIFREVIVIDDDDDDDESDESDPYSPVGESTGVRRLRSPSVEFITSRAQLHDLEPDERALANLSLNDTHRHPHRTIYVQNPPAKRLPAAQKRSYASYLEETPTGFHPPTNREIRSSRPIAYPKRLSRATATPSHSTRDPFGGGLDNRATGSTTSDLRSVRVDPSYSTQGIPHDRVRGDPSSRRNEFALPQSRPTPSASMARTGRSSDLDHSLRHDPSTKRSSVAEREVIVPSIEGNSSNRGVPLSAGLSSPRSSQQHRLEMLSSPKSYEQPPPQRPTTAQAPENAEYLVDNSGKIIGRLVKHPENLKYQHEAPLLFRERERSFVYPTDPYMERPRSAGILRSPPHYTQRRHDYSFGEGRSRDVIYLPPERYRSHEYVYDHARSSGTRDLERALYYDPEDPLIKPTDLMTCRPIFKSLERRRNSEQSHRQSPGYSQYTHADSFGTVPHPNTRLVDNMEPPRMSEVVYVRYDIPPPGPGSIAYRSRDHSVPPRGERVQTVFSSPGNDPPSRFTSLHASGGGVPPPPSSGGLGLRTRPSHDSLRGRLYREGEMREQEGLGYESQAKRRRGSAHTLPQGGYRADEFHQPPPRLG